MKCCKLMICYLLFKSWLLMATEPGGVEPTHEQKVGVTHVDLNNLSNDKMVRQEGDKKDNLQQKMIFGNNFDFLNQSDWRVRTIKINLQKYASVSEAFIQAYLGVKEGDVLRSKTIDTATKHLSETGWVNDIRWEVKKLADQELDLILTLEICPKISGFKFVGNKNFRDNTLIYEMKSRVHSPSNIQRLQQDALRLQKFYTSKGYCKAQIKVKSYPSQPGYEEICITIDEGACYKIKQIKFEGVSAFKESELKDVLHTKTWWLFSFFTKSGRLDEEKLQADIEGLRNFYQNAGYLDAVIERQNIRLEENGKNLCIVFPIEEGTRYRFGDISVSSDEPKDEEKLKEAIKGLKSGNPASPMAIDAACEAIRDFYGQQGFVGADVKVKRIFADEDKIDICFTVKKGFRYRIHSIYISGNIHTQSRVILRELNLAPGDILDYTRMKRAEMRLQNTGFFKNVLVMPLDCNMPYEKDLKITVEENKTGNIFFSGGFNNIQKFMFGVTLSQNNFDYKNSKDYFRGAGQKFQIGTSLGKFSQSVDLSFEEPWLLDRELRFGFNLFFSTDKLDSKHYKNRRIGGEIYLGKRLFEQVEGRLYYHLEHFKLTGVERANVSQAIRDEQGGRIISKIGFLMERDTRNHLIYPTRGTYLSWDNQIAGLGGKAKYFRTRGSAARWFLISPYHEQVFMIGTRAGWIRGLGGREVSLFDREFLGGPDDLRGFDYREVGPKAYDRPKTNLGGKISAFFKAEYSIKLHSIVRMIGFFDIGHVKKMNNKYLAPKSGGVNSDVGFGFRIHILNAPLRLDFAFPLKTDAYNKKQAPHISYSFGTSF